MAAVTSIGYINRVQKMIKVLWLGIDFCAQYLHSICSNAKRKIYEFDYFCVIAKNDYRMVAFEAICRVVGISPNKQFALVYYGIFSTNTVLALRNAFAIRRYVSKYGFKR
ncbi:MAG: hypothetical protein JWN14_4869 [Chthonomonadales bacterium]|nr:hypothetical protein [Chthonomonadales bacterium]